MFVSSSPSPRSPRRSAWSPSGSHGERPDLLLDPLPDSAGLHIKVVLGLKIQPEPLGGSEVSSQPERSVGRDRASAMDDLVDPARRNQDVLGEAILTDTHRDQELLQEDLPRMDRCKSLGHHRPLVIVDDLDVVGIATMPSKADSPLIVDPDAVLSEPITSQPLKPVARRHAKIV